jgi:hypothetical protein
LIANAFFVTNASSKQDPIDKIAEQYALWFVFPLNKAMKHKSKPNFTHEINIFNYLKI